LDYTDGGDYITIGLDSTLKSNYDAAYTHIGESGASHTYIDQSVISGATPTFTGTNFTAISADDVNITDAGVIITATEVEAALQENRVLINTHTTSLLGKENYTRSRILWYFNFVDGTHI